MKIPKFGSVAQQYDKYRPRYPKQVRDILIEGIDASELNVLEIGCGTGQATELFAEVQGVKLWAIDPARESVELASKKYSQKGVRFSVTKFEELEYSTGEFDLIYSAHAFHWIEPKLGYPALNRALSSQGRFGIFRNTLRDDAEVFAVTHDTWCKYFSPENPSQYVGGLAISYDQTRDAFENELRDTKMFSTIVVHEISNDLSYSTQEYLGYLSSESQVFELEPEMRNNYLSEVGEIIDAKLNGKVSFKNNVLLIVCDR